MKDNSQMYFTTGEFAKLCGTTKETLRHYDALGLLQPEERGENGYGYYMAWQFFDYDMIYTLKEAGSSLKEIKDYMEQHDTEDFIQLLQEKDQQLEREKEKLERMQRFLRRTVEVTKNALHAVYGVPQLQHCPEEYLIAKELPEGGDATLVEAIGLMQEHVEYLNQSQLNEEYQMGSIILKEHLEQGLHFDSYYYTKVYEQVDNPRLHVKPEGDYVVMLHKGPFIETDTAYQQMFDYIREQGLQICGNGYEYNMVDGLAAGNMEDFITQISIQVK